MNVKELTLFCSTLVIATPLFMHGFSIHTETPVSIPALATSVTLTVRVQDMTSRGNIPPTPSDRRSILLASVEVGPPKPRPRQATVIDKDLSKPYGWRYEEYAEGVFIKAGLPRGLARAMLRIESKTGRLKISKTNCKGWYQFCSKTAKAYDVEDPFDLAQSTHAAKRLAKDNTASLRALKVPVNSLHIYLAHQIGPRNFQSVWKVVNGQSVSAHWIKKAKTAMKSNWHKGMGTKTGLAKKDFPVFYQYFKTLFKRYENPKFKL